MILLFSSNYSELENIDIFYCENARDVLRKGNVEIAITENANLRCLNKISFLSIRTFDVRYMTLTIKIKENVVH